MHMTECSLAQRHMETHIECALGISAMTSIASTRMQKLQYRVKASTRAATVKLAALQRKKQTISQAVYSVTYLTIATMTSPTTSQAECSTTDHPRTTMKSPTTLQAVYSATDLPMTTMKSATTSQAVYSVTDLPETTRKKAYILARRVLRY